MALTEKRILKSVTVIPPDDTINVCWEDQILRDAEVVSCVPTWCGYNRDQKEQFLAEVENAAAYAAILGW